MLYVFLIIRLIFLIFGLCRLNITQIVLFLGCVRLELCNGKIIAAIGCLARLRMQRHDLIIRNRFYFWL